MPTHQTYPCLPIKPTHQDTGGQVTKRKREDAINVNEVVNLIDVDKQSVEEKDQPEVTYPCLPIKPTHAYPSNLPIKRTHTYPSVRFRS